MGADVHLVFDVDRCGMIAGPPRPPIKMREDRRSHVDRAVVADRHSVWMDVIDIDLLTDPHSFADSNSPQPVERRSHAAAAGTEVSNLLQEPLNEVLHEHDPANDTAFAGAMATPLQS
jgi:hypothetical protein